MERCASRRSFYESNWATIIVLRFSLTDWTCRMTTTSDARITAETQRTSRTSCRGCWTTTRIPGRGPIARDITLPNFSSESPLAVHLIVVDFMLGTWLISRPIVPIYYFNELNCCQNIFAPFSCSRAIVSDLQFHGHHSRCCLLLRSRCLPSNQISSGPIVRAFAYNSESESEAIVYYTTPRDRWIYIFNYSSCF